MTVAAAPPAQAVRSGAAAWWAAVRPATLWLGATPVLLGTALAAAADGLHPARAALALGVAASIQVGTNLFNDWADARRGADGPDRIGPARAVAQGWLTPRAVLVAAALAFAVAAALGSVLAWQVGWPLLALGAVCILSGLAYTGGPFPLAYVGLGDPFVLVFFGGVATCGTTWVQTQALTPAAGLAGAAIGLLATAVLVVNNLRDRHTDRRAGKRTLAVRLGARFARLEYATCVGLALALPPTAWALGWGGPGWLLPLLAAPLAVRRVQAVWRRDGQDLNPELGATARLQLAFGLLLAAGVLV